MALKATTPCGGEGHSRDHLLMQCDNENKCFPILWSNKKTVPGTKIYCIIKKLNLLLQFRCQFWKHLGQGMYVGISQLVYHLVRNLGSYWRSTDQTELGLDTEESIHKLKHLGNADFNFSFTGWWDHNELNGKWRQSTSVPYINKDTHPPSSLRFNTKHQPGLELHSALLPSSSVTYHAKAMALWFWWLFQSTKVILTLWALPAGSCTQMQELRCWGDDAQTPNPYSTLCIQSQKLFLLNVYSAVSLQDLPDRSLMMSIS